MKYGTIIILAFLLAGCAHTKVSNIQPLDLSPIRKTADMVKDDIVAKRYPEAIKGIDGLKKEVDRIQKVADDAAQRENSIRNDYNEVVADRDQYRREIWKWRLGALALALWIVVPFLWKFRHFVGIA